MDADRTSTDSTDAFTELGRIVLGEEPLEQILERIVRIATQLLPTVGEASITVLGNDGAYTIAFTGDLALALDERQYEDETGPCLDAAASGARILIPDMSGDVRWPRFAQAAREAGIGSSLSIPLPVQRQLTGALNFYAGDPEAFDEPTVEVAETFAAHAAVAVANAHLYQATAQLADQMRQAMTSRAAIEQAKGIVMRDLNCSPDDAFDALVRLSQESHLKLRDVAQRLVDQASGPR